MNKDTDQQKMPGLYAITLVCGFFSGVAIYSALSVLNLPQLESGVFALLGGFTVGAFVYRERSLTLSFEHFRNENSRLIARYEKQIYYYYSRSLAPLVCFDASTLLVDKASPGFLQLLRASSDLNVRGKSIEDLLGVPRSSLDAMVSECRREQFAHIPQQLNIKDAAGHEFLAEVALEYVKDQHMVEATFFVSPSLQSDESDMVDISDGNLERYRKGLFRRETRIIELKEEVNRILEEVGREPRYTFGQMKQGIDFPINHQHDWREGE